MGFISTSVKRVFFWTYPRTSWEWDVLCVLILVFIFLTPKSWFESRHRPLTTVVLAADVVRFQEDKGIIEAQARSISGRQDGQIIEVRKRRDESGKLIAYEVDVR